MDRSKLNVMGGSIAIGHPFGATGGRILTTLCNELARRGGQFGLMTVCAAGGMGHAMVVERALMTTTLTTGATTTASPSSRSTCRASR